MVHITSEVLDVLGYTFQSPHIRLAHGLFARVSHRFLLCQL